MDTGFYAKCEERKKEKKQIKENKKILADIQKKEKKKIWSDYSKVHTERKGGNYLFAKKKVQKNTMMYKRIKYL